MSSFSPVSSLRRWLLGRHRGLALWIALPALAWSLTGLLHPVMSRWQPSAATMTPPAELLAPPAGMSWSDLPAPATVLPGDESLRELRALTWQGQPYWMLQLPDGQRQYVEAGSGRPADIERALVERLARHYAGDSQAAVTLSEVRAFSSEYPSVNRYLPVWRVAFDRPDGLVAFIEPRSLKLAALTDTWKTRFSALFRNLHSWVWWPDEASRDFAMCLALGLVAFMTLTGVARASAGSASGRPPLRRWHRRVGLLAALAVLAWCSSAIFHVLAVNKERPAFTARPLALSFAVSEVSHPAPADVPPEAMLQVLATFNGPVWHWQQLMSMPGEGGHHHGGRAMAAPMLHEDYVSASTGQPVSALDHVRALTASAAGGARWLGMEPVTKFTDEYGFVQKRLPVYKVSFATPDHLAVYVDPADTVVAAVVRDLDRAEGFSFAYLHKAHWLDFLGKDLRDAVTGAFALLVFGLVLAGLRLLRRRG